MTKFEAIQIKQDTKRRFNSLKSLKGMKSDEFLKYLMDKEEKESL